MPMLADSPKAYLGQPGFDFLRQVPTTWDETRVLDGEVGEYIVVARRKGCYWFVGAMTSWTPRKLKVPLKFIPKGRYDIETWADALNSQDPNQLVLQAKTIKSGDVLHLNLARGGGEVILLKPANPAKK
jgi:alpha-glucosidase